MRGIRRWFPLAVVLAALLAVGGWASGSVTHAATSTISVTLTGNNEVPPVTGGGSATASFQFDDQTGQLSYTLTIQGIAPTDVTAAHIHLGAPGVNGPILHPLTVSKSSSTTSGAVTLNSSEIGYLKQGSLYVNVHSTEHPSGFARAQLVLSAESQIRAQIAQVNEAYNAKDINALLVGFTDNGILTTFGFSSRAEAQQNAEEIFAGPPLVITVNSVKVTGSTATVDLTLAFGPQTEHDVDTLILKDGVWLVDNTTIVPEPIPAGAKAVSLSLQEYAFVYDKSAIPADGNFGFDITNVGKEEHEVALIRIPAGMTVADLLAFVQQAGPDTPEPAGVEDVAHAGPIEPGQHTTMVFSSLAPGHYAMLCFMPDPNGVPHALLGMISDFTVGTSQAGAGTSGIGTSTAGSISTGSGTITPPNTGDAGLKAETVSTAESLLATLLLVTFVGASAFALSRRRIDR